MRTIDTAWLTCLGVEATTTMSCPVATISHSTLWITNWKFNIEYHHSHKLWLIATRGAAEDRTEQASSLGWWLQTQARSSNWPPSRPAGQQPRETGTSRRRIASTWCCQTMVAATEIYVHFRAQETFPYSGPGLQSLLPLGSDTKWLVEGFGAQTSWSAFTGGPRGSGAQRWSNTSARMPQRVAT